MSLRLCLALLLGLLATAGCRNAQPAAREQIPQRIEGIRSSIVAMRAEGIMHWGTPDWRFIDGEGKVFDREAYLVRARAMFAQIEAVESLETSVDSIEASGDQAIVRITQLMVRRDKDPSTGAPRRLQLRYQERQEWLRGADGWRVREVRFTGVPERKLLPPQGS